MTVSTTSVWDPRVNATRYLGAEYTVLVTDKNLIVSGDPIEEWTQLQVTLRWKEPGSGQITVPALPYIVDMLKPGCRIVILRRLWDRQHTLIAGPLESTLRERSDDGEHGGVGTLTVTFADDLAWLGARIAYANPALAPGSQTTDHWVFNGDPVSAMLQLVNTQAGAGARSERRVPQLITNTPAAITGTTSVKIASRLEKLTDVLRSICTLGVGSSITYHPDSLGFRTRQSGEQILFEPLRSNDLAGQVHFSFAAGNLQYYSMELNAPKMTHPHVGGQADLTDDAAGAARFYDVFPPEANDPSLAWGRFEAWVPKDGTLDRAYLADEAVKALHEQGENRRLASNASDTPDQRFGVHYNVGDIVSLELDNNQFVRAPVQVINVQVYPTAGEVAGLTIGDQSARYADVRIAGMKAMQDRLAKLERDAALKAKREAEQAAAG